MTVFGGVENDSGVVEDGFFIVCAKCGWHSEVQIYGAWGHGYSIICGRCDNEYNHDA